MGKFSKARGATLVRLEKLLVPVLEDKLLSKNGKMCNFSMGSKVAQVCPARVLNPYCRNVSALEHSKAPEGGASSKPSKKSSRAKKSFS